METHPLTKIKIRFKFLFRFTTKSAMETIPATLIAALILMPVGVAKAAGNWGVHSEQSPIDDSTNVFLHLMATEEIRTKWGNTRPTLIIRCKEKKTEVYVNFNIYLGIEETRVTHRLDQKPAQTSRWNISTDHEAVSKPNPVSFVRRMMQHETLLVQLTPYGESPVIATFDIWGLSLVIEPLQQACRWTTVPPKRADNVETAQRYLRALGYKVGQIDGIYGPETAAAIRQFQQDQQLPVDGEVSDQLLQTLAHVYTYKD